MSNETLSSRQERERRFYDQYSALAWSGMNVNFDPIRGSEKRPWNSYWFFYETVQAHYRGPEQRLLDFGCGVGDASVLYATIGYEVWGFDISPNNVALSIRNADRYGVSGRTHFKEGIAEHLDHEADYFDIIVGIDILHHVNVTNAIRECWRVLKPGGVAIFHEPVVAPVFDRLRRSRFGRWLVPNEASFDKHITEDERKLDAADLAAIRTSFPHSTNHRFRLVTRATKLLPHYDGMLGRLERFDQRLLSVAPFLKRFTGTTVLVLEKRGAT